MKSNIYTNFESTVVWDILDKTINELVENQDMEEKTSRKYLLGYIIKNLKDSGCIRNDMLKIK